MGTKSGDSYGRREEDRERGGGGEKGRKTRSLKGLRLRGEKKYQKGKVALFFFFTNERETFVRKKLIKVRASLGIGEEKMNMSEGEGARDSRGRERKINKSSKGIKRSVVPLPCYKR